MMFVTCASMRHISKDIPGVNKPDTGHLILHEDRQPTSIMSNPKRHKQDDFDYHNEIDNDYDKENMNPSPNLRQKIQSMTSTPKAVPYRSILNKNDFPTPNKQTGKDRSFSDLSCSPRTLSTSKRKVMHRRAFDEHMTTTCTARSRGTVSMSSDYLETDNKHLSPRTLNHESNMLGFSDTTNQRRECSPSPCHPASLEQSASSESMSELYTSKALKNISVISQQPGIHIHEQASSANLSGDFHSTFNYPLHSTLNYPLYSSFNLSDNFGPRFSEKVVLGAPDSKLVASKHVSGHRSTRSEHSNENETTNWCNSSRDSSTFCDSSCLSDDESSIDVDEYASRYDSMTMKRQNGQSELSGNKTSLLFAQNQPCDVMTDHSSELILSGVPSGLNLKEDLTIPTRYTNLPNVWYSPNKTLKCHREVSTPSNQHLTTKREKCSRLSDNISISWPSDNNTSFETLTTINRSKKHTSVEGVSSCKFSPRHTSRNITITDNTGRNRTIPLPESSQIHYQRPENRNKLIHIML